MKKNNSLIKSITAGIILIGLFTIIVIILVNIYS